MSLALTQAKAAGRMGVDQGTLARWEQAKREPIGKFAAIAEQFLASGQNSSVLGCSA